MRHQAAKGNKPLRPSATCVPQQVIDHAARAFVAGSGMRKLHGEANSDGRRSDAGYVTGPFLYTFPPDSQKLPGVVGLR